MLLMGFDVFCILMKSLSQKLKRLRPLLGTYVSIELEGEGDERQLNACITEGFEAINEIDQLMSYHRSDSDLTCLNLSRAGEWIEASPLTCEVLQVSNELYSASNGVFDIRCGAFLAKQGIIPNPFEKEINVLNYLDILPVEINGVWVRKTGDWILDLGGIAKGYAVDCAVKRIKQQSLGMNFSGIVNAGGDLSVWGEIDVSMATRIEASENPMIYSFKVNETAAATSTVRNIYLPHLNSCGHVRMPSGVLLEESKTVTIFAKQCLLADALTKIVLLAPGDIAKRCLSVYEAEAAVFLSNGQFEKVIN